MSRRGIQALRTAIAIAVLLLSIALLAPLAAARAAVAPASGSGLRGLATARLASAPSEEEFEEEGEEEGSEGEEESEPEAQAREREEEREEEEEGEEEGSEGLGRRSRSRSSRPGQASHRLGGGRQSAHLSRLGITAAGRGALRHHHPPATSVSFSFRLDAATKVQVTLATQAVVHGHIRWHTLASFRLTARKGSNVASLRGHRLMTGLDRIVVSASGAPGQDLAFRVR